MCVAALLCVILPSVRAELTGELGKFEDRCNELREQGKWPQGQAVAQQFVARALELHGEDNDATATAIHQLAWFTQYNGDFARAEKLWWRALNIDEKLHGKDSIETARRLLMLGGFYREKGDFNRGREFLQRALAIRERHLGKDHLLTCNVLYELGRLSTSIGDLDGAENCFRSIILSLEGAADDRDSQFKSDEALTKLAEIYRDRGDSAKAEPLLVRTLLLRERFLGAKHADTAAAMRNLAGLYSDRRDFTRAEPLFQKALAIEEEVYGVSEQFKMFHTLEGFGVMYLNSNRRSKAEPLLMRALSVAEGNSRVAHENAASVLRHLGWLNELKGDYNKAADFLEQAYHIYEQNRGRLHPLTTARLGQLARVRLAQGRSEDVLSFADQIQDGEEKYLADGLSSRSERQRLFFLHEWFLLDRYDLWATLGATRPLARAILRTKGIVLDSLLEDLAVAEASANPEVRQLASQLANAKQRLSQLSPVIAGEMSNSGSLTLKTNEIEAASREVEFLEMSLARRVTALGGARRALATQVADVQAAIPKEAALVEMLRYHHYQGKGVWGADYGALILFKEGEPIWVRLGPAAPIDKNIKLYQHLVRSPGEQEALAPLLRELCEQVWQPVQSALPADITHVVISPDAELNFLSFATLLTQGGFFVGEKFDIGYISTARDLLANSASVAGTVSLAVWANPDFGASVARPASASVQLVASRAASARELRNLRLQPLPGSEKEGRLLSQMASEFGFKEVFLHLGPGATEAQLRRVHSPRVLHLATHGFVLPELSGEPSAPAPDAESLFARRSQAANNPMLRSGLALAGARRTIEAWGRGEAVPADNDGIVTAEDIGTLDLKNTWLVVLSACDTGLGEARSGEGVLGLRRGFIQAGAKNLLMTLWPIDDARTADLIADFYAADKELRNAAKALSVTQRTWLARLRAEKGTGEACRVAGAFILSFQGSATSR